MARGAGTGGEDEGRLGSPAGVRPPGSLPRVPVAPGAGEVQVLPADNGAALFVCRGPRVTGAGPRGGRLRRGRLPSWKEELSRLEREPEETEMISAKWSSHPSPCLRAAAGGTALPAGGSWGAACLESPGLGSSGARGVFVCPLGLRGAAAPVSEPACKLSCCRPASARSEFGKRDHPASKEAKFKGDSETSGLAGTLSMRGVLFFSSFLSLSSYCGHLAGVCSLSSHFLREGTKTKKAFCRSYLFGCKTLLIGYNTVYEFSQMSKY